MSEIVFESPADQQGFTQIPNVVLTDGMVSPQAKMLYACLRMHAWSADSSYPGQQRLAGYLGCSDRSVRDYLRELEGQCLVTTERRGSTSNRYVLLALGLRAKRLANRNSGSDRDDRNPGSDQTGTLVPIKKTQRKKTQTPTGIESARTAGRVKVSGRCVNPEAWALTASVLDVFNEQTGRDLRLLTSGGLASEAAKRIYGRVRAYPDLSLDDHRRIIANTLASKWWGEDRESVGVVYGPKVFEENISRKPGPRVLSAADQRAKDKQADAAHSARLRESFLKRRGLR